MHDAETRALRRAAIVLLSVSLVRWGWSRSTEDLVADPAGDAVPALLDASREAADDAERRIRPLRAGERIDPNRASEVELDRLPGVGPATARSIIAARERGDVFSRPEDLLGVRGIGPAALERIQAYLDLDRPPSTPRRSQPRSTLRETRVDVNRATPEVLETLPGVGPALARRILEARQERLFTSIEDLTRVRGIGAATVRALRERVVVREKP